MDFCSGQPATVIKAYVSSSFATAARLVSGELSQAGYVRVSLFAGTKQNNLVGQKSVSDSLEHVGSVR